MATVKNLRGKLGAMTVFKQDSRDLPIRCLTGEKIYIFSVAELDCGRKDLAEYKEEIEKQYWNIVRGQSAHEHFKAYQEMTCTYDSRLIAVSKSTFSNINTMLNSM